MCRCDTEPAFAFHPGLPDRQPIKGPQRFDTTIAKTPAVKAPSNLEDVAFWRVVDLAPLVKSRAVSSTDLTKMYLARMKKYSPKLLCLITLDGRTRRWSRRRPPIARFAPDTIADRCTGFRSG